MTRYRDLSPEQKVAIRKKQHLKDPDIQQVPNWPMGTPKPSIKITDLGGWCEYEIRWKGQKIWSGDASRHGDCLSAAQRNRIRLMREILKGQHGGI